MPTTVKFLTALRFASLVRFRLPCLHCLVLWRFPFVPASPLWIGTRVSGSNLYIRMQSINQSTTKDGAAAWHANRVGGNDVGTYHFMHMQEPPKVDEHLKDGISTTPVSEQAQHY